MTRLMRPLPSIAATPPRAERRTALMLRLPRKLQVMLTPSPAWYGLGAALVLTLLGIEAINTVDSGSAEKQLQIQFPIALTVMVLCMLPHPRVIGMAAYPLFLFSLALLVFVILPFVPRAIVPRINGATAWINLGLMNFQPSELAKIAFVLSLAWYLRYRESYRSFLGLFVPFVIMFIPVGLILKEPDLGQSLVFPPTLFAMLIAAGAKLRHLALLVGMGVLAVGLNVGIILLDPPHLRTSTSNTEWMHVMASHQERRIAAMVWPERYADTDAFQQIVGTRLVGAGGFTGVGKERAKLLTEMNGLPEPHNDMITSVIGLRWGLMGMVVLLSLYFLLALSFLTVAARSKEPMARLACVGFTAIVCAQVVVNVGMNLGVVPIIGITLPFISYGGSSLLAMFAMIGLALNFASRRPLFLARPSFEFDNSERAFQ